MIPRNGGSLDLNGHGIAGCVVCGWRGVPTFDRGVPMTFCPACHHGEPPRSAGGARNAPCPCGSGRKYKKCCGS